MTSSPAGSPANLSVSPGNDSPKTTPDGSGPSSSESFAWYDPDMSSWKTSQGSLLPEWATYSETWPRSGTTVNGKAFRLPLLAPHTYDGGSSSWPTPQASEGHPAVQGRDPWKRAASGKQVQLTDRVRMWPTPAAQESQPTEEFVQELRANQDSPNQRTYLPGRKWHTQNTLSRAVRLWPTPRTPTGGRTVREKRPSKVTGSYLEEALADPERYFNPERSSELSDAVAVQLWPTPTESMADRVIGPKDNHDTVAGLRALDPSMIGGQLNPTWVEWLMGFPEGWTALED